ncbi:hypothetical protein HY409_03425 [Candidatus Gottesmanbacteria bacterium]|nr:hypothetical protein [Candidatus Gottesmanbacteria bacterium]
MRTIKVRHIGKRLLFFCIVILVGISAYVLLVNIFTIDAIEVQGDGIGVDVNQQKLPKNLLFFPIAKITKQILLDNPLVESLTIQKKYPRVLILKVKARSGVANVVASTMSAVVDASGVIIGIDRPKDDIPTIEHNIFIGTIGSHITDEYILTALTFIEKVKSFVKIQKITNVNSDYLQAVFDKTDILFPQKTDMSKLADTLQTLLSGFRIKGTMPSTIDLRYDKPVVTY